ncbi:hypothetical protein IAT38_006221 [Cryptococcus sp. DSM 104549]
MSSQPAPAVEEGLSATLSRAESHHRKDQYIFKRLRKEMPLPSKRLSMVMLAVLFGVMFLAGWNDASQGPLLPSLQVYYNVNYLVIAIIWLTNFVGFMTAGITNVYITDRVGFGIAAPLGAFMQAVGYVFMCWGSPYPLFLIAYIFNGFGLGIQDAQVNSLTSRLPSATTKMFLMHAWYGFGATVSPFVSTAFVQHVPNEVYYYYAVSLGLAVITLAALVLTFKFRTDDQLVGMRVEEEVDEKDGGGAVESAEAGAGVTVPPGETAEAPVEQAEKKKKKENTDSGGKMKAIMKTPVVHYMAFYILSYVGIEVTIGGWATSFLIDQRGGDSNSGYVSAGYFGGLTVGRIVLIPVSHYLGPHRSITIYSLISIALLFVIWFTKTIVGNAICYSFIGVFLGPMYPIVMNVVLDVVPGDLQGGTIGWIASLGQAGSAMMPFITGAISEKHGTWILQPLIIAFIFLSLLLWLLIIRAGHPDRPWWHVPQAATGEAERKEKEKKWKAEQAGEGVGESFGLRKRGGAQSQDEQQGEGALEGAGAGAGAGAGPGKVSRETVVGEETK